MRSITVNHLLISRCFEIENKIYSDVLDVNKEYERKLSSLCNDLRGGSLLGQAIILGNQIQTNDLMTASIGRLNAALLSSNVESLIPSEMERSRIMFYSGSRHVYPGMGASERFNTMMLVLVYLTNSILALDSVKNFRIFMKLNRMVDLIVVDVPGGL